MDDLKAFSDASPSSPPSRSQHSEHAKALDSPFLGRSGELWALVSKKDAIFLPRHFLAVIDNLIKNPNITSSCVFRADVYYDSSKQAPMFDNTSGQETFDHAIKHLKKEYRPQAFMLDGYNHNRTIVRKMIPRNPSLDAALLQTCHFFSRFVQLTKHDSGNSTQEDHIFVMIPHVSDVSSIPFYHPKVRGLAIRYLYNPSTAAGNLFVYYNFFASHQLDHRLERTALNLLNIVHKHSTGQASGYTKRVHHDQIIPQPRFQDTYTRLKIKYAKQLIGNWAEETDPTKHVFEDLGIAAFLIELWRDMYPVGCEFPGFVDIGCGNGILVNILIQEGYRGWGLEARPRKSWGRFPLEVRDCLSARILAPSVLKIAPGTESDTGAFHSGQFPEGTFIVSNHADELTPWTPLIAFLNFAPFIAIPCCSHNLAGARCRFNTRSERGLDSIDATDRPTFESTCTVEDGPGPKSGSLARAKGAAKQPSAYQSLTNYVVSLAKELGFDTQKEMLRIPSTRNAAIVGKVSDHGMQQADAQARLAYVNDIVHREVGEMDQVVKDWLSNAEKLARRPSEH
ncbi:uncharacterized protein PV09_07784 [Verruconis gallopava]|uniref:tRNA (uracil-O(2)-)-methyltransferase n=1 Tax=Verruconis gallopava TaxID=253628 RepID=A0A0D2A340_9PEZI|nr:uncharacterized protein PV09_07784 [Verruconis gallopava]KIW00805.1 hypothetical protein PV09_07784 [Verruconis gallopava]